MVKPNDLMIKHSSYSLDLESREYSSHLHQWM